MENETIDAQPEPTPAEILANALIRQIAGLVIAAILLFGLGLGSGYLTFQTATTAWRCWASWNC